MRHFDVWVSVDTPPIRPRRCSSSALSRRVFAVGVARRERDELGLVDVPLIAPAAPRVVYGAAAPD
jgi:hypothetical protein